MRKMKRAMRRMKQKPRGISPFRRGLQRLAQQSAKRAIAVTLMTMTCLYVTTLGTAVIAATMFPNAAATIGAATLTREILRNDETPNTATAFAASETPITDTMIWDSGCTDHVINASVPTTNQRESPGTINGINAPTKYRYRADTAARRQLLDCIILPTIETSLISISKYLRRSKSKILIDGPNMFDIDPQGRKKLIGTCNRDGLYEAVSAFTTPMCAPTSAANHATAPRQMRAIDTILDDHNRCGHASLAKLRQYMARGSVKLTSTAEQLANATAINCHICSAGRLNRTRNPKRGQTIDTLEPLDKLAADFSGERIPGRDLIAAGTESADFTKFLVITDLSPRSKMRWAIPLTSKSARNTEDAFRRLFVHIQLSEWAKGRKIKRIRFDNEIFDTARFKTFLANCKIDPEYVTPYDKAANGGAEKSIDVITALANKLLAQAPDIHDCENSFWPAAVRWAAYLDQRIPKTATGKSPMEMLTGQIPLATDMPPLFATCFVRKEKEEKDDKNTKADDVTFPAIFMGIPGWQTTGWLVYVPELDKLYVRRSIIVDPNINDISPGRLEEMRSKTFRRRQTVVYKKYRRDSRKMTARTAEPEPETADPPPSTATEPSTDPESRIPDSPTQPAPPTKRITRSMTRADRANMAIDALIKAEASQTPFEIPEIDIDDMEDVEPVPFEWPTEGQARSFAATAEPAEHWTPHLTPDRTDLQTKLRADQVYKPTNPSEALNGRPPAESYKWWKAMTATFADEIANGTFVWKKRTGNEVLLDTKWVYSVKPDDDGFAKRWRARLTLRGFRQKPHRDYDPDKTFAPVVGITTLLTMLASTATMPGIMYRQIDVKRAFVVPKIDMPNMYLKVPFGMQKFAPGRDYVLHVQKPLEGSKQGAFLWWHHFANLLREFGAEQSSTDPCLWKVHRHGATMWVATWVDDAPIATTSEQLYEEFVSFLESRKITLSYKGPLRTLLGCRFTHTNEGILMDQKVMIEDLLAEYGMTNCKERKIPMQKTAKYSRNDGPPTTKPFRELVGALSHIAIYTEPAISTALRHLSQFQNNPSDDHYEGLKEILRYLAFRINNNTLGRFIGKQTTGPQISAYFDASHATELDAKSRTGAAIKVHATTVAVISKKQPTVALSSTISEFFAACQTERITAEVTEILKFFEHVTDPAEIFTDSNSVYKMLRPWAPMRGSRWLRLYFHKIKEARDTRAWAINWVERSKNFADGLTHPVPYAQFTAMQEWISGISHGKVQRIHSQVNAAPDQIANSMARAAYALLATAR